ncbi:MAG: hypothetical protein R3B96_19995 [Pirellulaceae bacterium]
MLGGLLDDELDRFVAIGDRLRENTAADIGNVGSRLLSQERSLPAIGCLSRLGGDAQPTGEASSDPGL